MNKAREKRRKLFKGRNYSRGILFKDIPQGIRMDLNKKSFTEQTTIAA